MTIESRSSRLLAVVSLLILGFFLAGCGGGERSDLGISNSFSPNAPQPFPANYRVDLIAFLKTYLNDPRGIRDASLAEPSLREVRTRKLFVACLRYNARDPNGVYAGASERAVVFVDGRLDRLIEDGKEFCTAAIYQPFPEMEKLVR